ncbi:pilus assembly protein (plasmid) [Halopseudomonas sp. SMJS2]|uniref:type II secretion system protein GspD n=1 Tax=Halopseudomonas sp. SMJS2 TaxID=3041098 RepID=UPI002453149D|nr:pilus assembly protein [Halopseudomonas sp. SMJS2]WGK63359.1 pilus assembly protein [Halopseudomonas sp. SMJS2]
MMITRIALSLMVAAGLAGCAAGNFEFSEETKHSDLIPDQEAQMQAARGTTFVREIRSEDLAMQRPIYLTAQNKSLRFVLQETLPGYSIIPRGQVDLNSPIDVSARGMLLSDFIEYIEGTRDLNIEVVGNRVYVSDFETREWNLSAFAATRSVTTLVTSAQTGGAKAGDSAVENSNETTSSSVGYTLTEDEWLNILKGARTIIGAPEEDEEDDAKASEFAPAGGPLGMPGEGLNFDLASMDSTARNAVPYVSGIRSVGIVTAGGPPARMSILDRYLRKAIEESTKIVNVQVEAYDVVLNDNKQKGINWDALVSGTLNGNPFGLDFFNKGAINEGSDSFWNVAGTYEGSRGSANLLVKFLETFGTVELKDQPNITVRNGVPAQIYAGEELTYVVDIEQVQDEHGNVTVTPKLARLKIGVTLSVTVRILEDDRLLVDIMPVISNLNAPDVVQVGEISFETPRVALKEFSTQLITTSGNSVHLGGLISERMSKAMEQLPWQNIFTRNVLNPITQNLNNNLERRELVLVVTPTLIEGVY